MIKCPLVDTNLPIPIDGVSHLFASHTPSDIKKCIHRQPCNSTFQRREIMISLKEEYQSVAVGCASTIHGQAIFT